MKDYPLKHQQGYISIEQELKQGMIKGDMGIQIAKDGRIWVCIDGKALIRFMPEFKTNKKNNKNIKIEEKNYERN